MTDITELRRWSAEDLLELEEVSPKSCIKPNTFFESNSGKIYICLDDPDIGWIDWTPDLPSGQIWLVIKKMRELGFISFQLVAWPNKVEWSAQFNGICRFASTSCKAILFAAKSALEAK